MISTSQVKLIRVASAKCKLNEEEYKALLSGYGVQHARDLDLKQVQEILKIFTSKLGFEYVKKTGTNVPADRPPQYATQKQLNMLAKLWSDKSRAKDRESLNKFCKRITGIDHIEWTMKKNVPKLVTAIKSLG